MKKPHDLVNISRVFEDADTALGYIRQHLSEDEQRILAERLGFKLPAPVCPHQRGSTEGTQWCALGEAPSQTLEASAAAIRAAAQDLITGLTEALAGFGSDVSDDARGRFTVLIDECHKLLTADDLGKTFLADYEETLQKIQAYRSAMLKIRNASTSHRKAVRFATNALVSIK